MIADMPVKPRFNKRRAEIAPEVLAFFENGDYRRSSLAFMVAAQVLAGSSPREWLEGRDELIADFIARYPGSRPWAWWAIEAPAGRNGVLRRRVGGSGTLVGEPRFHFGIPGYVDEDDPPRPGDPPRFESQAHYLRRHRLLTAAERRRLRPGAFAPETIDLDVGELEEHSA